MRCLLRADPRFVWLNLSVVIPDLSDLVRPDNLVSIRRICWLICTRILFFLCDLLINRTSHKTHVKRIFPPVICTGKGRLPVVVSGSWKLEGAFFQNKDLRKCKWLVFRRSCNIYLVCYCEVTVNANADNFQQGKNTPARHAPGCSHDYRPNQNPLLFFYFIT